MATNNNRKPHGVAMPTKGIIEDLLICFGFRSSK